MFILYVSEYLKNNATDWPHVDMYKYVRIISSCKHQTGNIPTVEKQTEFFLGCIIHNCLPVVLSTNTAKQYSAQIQISGSYTSGEGGLRPLKFEQPPTVGYTKIYKTIIHHYFLQEDTFVSKSQERRSDAFSNTHEVTFPAIW